ncbi:MAG: KH domain-containing protein [Fimbriimonadaceae bacterium]|nr:KH domain-containing protein [Fimbriimonadaceae bacterium]
MSAALVETLVKLTVQEPDVVAVNEVQDRGVTVFNVTVAPNDVGRVIGKEGRVISCIRQIVSAVASKERKRTVVKIATQD